MHRLDAVPAVALTKPTISTGAGALVGPLPRTAPANAVSGTAPPCAANRSGFPVLPLHNPDGMSMEEFGQ